MESEATERHKEPSLLSPHSCEPTSCSLVWAGVVAFVAGTVMLVIGAQNDHRTLLVFGIIFATLGICVTLSCLLMALCRDTLCLPMRNRLQKAVQKLDVRGKYHPQKVNKVHWADGGHLIDVKHCKGDASKCNVGLYKRITGYCPTNSNHSTKSNPISFPSCVDEIIPVNVDLLKPSPENYSYEVDEERHFLAYDDHTDKCHFPFPINLPSGDFILSKTGSMERPKKEGKVGKNPTLPKFLPRSSSLLSQYDNMQNRSHEKASRPTSWTDDMSLLDSAFSEHNDDVTFQPTLSQLTVYDNAPRGV